MGLFDRIKKEKNQKEMIERDINASGWDAITEACEKIYPTQKDPKHYGTLISWELGGNDPLRGISVYDGGDFWHFVTYGLSELYEKKSNNKEISGYGMEFTFKLKKDNYDDEEAEIRCICGILQSIARLTFTRGEIFKAYEYLYSGQTEGIDTKMKSNITGFITMPDQQLKTINTPNGKVDFVEFIGATNNELLALKNKEIDVKTLYEKIESDITNYNRNSVI
ncbi:MAG TPA: branched-chain alpha-keto acid dehydrogenase subunit E2 [Clostridiales bacterium]|nr:branched-chain alpha-keto acid dehydrogenase subunit E2 [Clostridiales bacterium]